MKDTLHAQVEFIGGPLDGHQDIVPLQPLIGIATVRSRIYQLPRPWCTIYYWFRPPQIRLAIYELEIEGERRTYHYLCSQVADARQINIDTGFIRFPRLASR